eukprot:6221457-Pyramimonas_sp.AAC.1
MMDASALLLQLTGGQRSLGGGAEPAAKTGNDAIIVEVRGGGGRGAATTVKRYSALQVSRNYRHAIGGRGL